MNANTVSRKIKAHKQYTDADYAYLSGKGYNDAEIITIWDRDAALGKAPLQRFVKAPDIVGYLNGKNTH